MNISYRLLTSRYAISERVGGLGLFGTLGGQERCGNLVSFRVGTSGTKVCFGDRSLSSNGATGQSNTEKGIDNEGNSGKKKRKKERIDSPYVLRRTAYLQKVQTLRKEFMKRIEADRAEKKRIETERKRQGFISAELRMQNTR